MTLTTHKWADLDEQGRVDVLRRPESSQDMEIARSAADIVAAVRSEGDAALRSLTAQLDGCELSAFQVGPDEIAAAEAALTDAQRDAIDLAIRNVRVFHEAQSAEPVAVETMPGVVCERVTHPIESVGLYVPAGSAPLPSAAIMLAVPADVAACPTRILCTPPRSDGKADPGVVVAATRAGVDTIFKIGGAQAIAALAYGTESVPKVRKIFGPGNAWVTAAKTLVSMDPAGAAIDMPAGPSEVLVIGDASANPRFVASDLLSQAEHGTDSQVVFITTSKESANDVRDEVAAQLESLPRKDIAIEAIANSLILIADDVDTAIAISNAYAPEHLILQIANARNKLSLVRNAGSVFVGQWTPESVGDYCSGTNHVLPTYGFAATYSGLGVDQFRRSMTIQELTRDGLASLADAVTTLATLEGLDAHAAAVTCRLEDRP